MKNKTSNWLPSIPKEHGAWIIMLGAFFSVVALFGQLHLSMVLFILSIIIFYWSRHIFLLILGFQVSKREIIWLILFLLSGWTLLIGSAYLTNYWLIIAYTLVMLIFFSVEIVFIRAKKQRSFLAQIIGTFGLTAVAPLTTLLLQKEITLTAGLLWLINALFFESEILFVRFQIARRKMKNSTTEEYRRFRRGLLYYHFLLLIFLLWIAFSVDGYAGLVIVFTPTILQSILAATNRLRIPTFRQLGWLETAQTLVFVLLLATVM